MPKAKQVTTRKGGKPSAQVVQKSIEDPNSHTVEDLTDIFGDAGEGEGLTDNIEGYSLEGAPIVRPTVTEDTDDELENGVGNPEPNGNGEPTPIEEPTQAAEGEEEETPTPPDQAALMELLPEKFRGEDLTEVLTQLASSYSELESAHGRTEQELAQATKILKGLGSQLAPKQPRLPVTPLTPVQPQQRTAVPVLSKEEEEALGTIFTNMDILEDPQAPLKAIYLLGKKAAQDDLNARLAQEEAKRQQEVAIRQQADQFNRFRAEHPDFDDLREDMLAVVRAEPHLDIPEAVEMVYEKARDIRAAKQVTQTQQTAQSVVSGDAFKAALESIMTEREKGIEERVRNEFEEKLKQGQAMKGTLDSGSAITPTSKERLAKATPSDKKRYRIQTDHKDFVTDDQELAEIITAERHDDRGLLNL